MGKAVFVGPVFFERSPSQDAGSNKDDVGRYRGKSDTAATMEGGDVVQALPETMHDKIETRQEYVTSVFDISESGDAASTEGGDNELVQETVATVQADITTVMETEFCGIDSSLMPTSKLAEVLNFTTTMESPKS